MRPPVADGWLLTFAKILNYTQLFETLPENHPLRENQEWISRFYPKLKFPEAVGIPVKKNSEEIPIRSCLTMIEYICRVRLSRLAESFILLALHSNTYGAAQIVRALYENAAILGHALKVGEGEPDAEKCKTLDRLINGQRFGIEDNDTANRTIHIQTSIKHAQKVLEDLTVKEFSDDFSKLYEIACEFVHPNFSSNFSEVEPNKVMNQLEYCLETQRKTLRGLVGHLRLALISNEQLILALRGRLEELE